MKAPEQTEQQLLATEEVLYPSSPYYWFTKYQLHVVGLEHGCFIGQSEDLSGSELKSIFFWWGDNFSPSPPPVFRNLIPPSFAMMMLCEKKKNRP